jgi:hypothetical protein
MASKKTKKWLTPFAWTVDDGPSVHFVAELVLRDLGMEVTAENIRIASAELEWMRRCALAEAEIRRSVDLGGHG